MNGESFSSNLVRVRVRVWVRVRVRVRGRVRVRARVRVRVRARARVRVRVSCVAHRRHEVEVLIRPRLERGVGFAQHLCLQGRVLTVRVHASDDDGSACPWLGIGFC